MLLYPVPKKNSGFTLLEMITVVIIIGVIAAIAAPNLLGMLNRQRVNEGIASVEGAIKEAQKQATRNGQSCAISTTNKSISGGCLLSSRNLKDNLVIATNTPTLTFSGKGNITFATGSEPTFVVYSNGTNRQRCLVIQTRLGTMRDGEFSGSLSAPVASACN